MADSPKCDHSGRDPNPLQPPQRYKGMAFHHWVERIDYDGRACGLEVYQWQPGVQKWCYPNQYACGQDKELVHYRWVALCPIPPFKEEVADVQKIIERLRQSFAEGSTDAPGVLTREEFAMISMMFAENIAPRSA